MLQKAQETHTGGVNRGRQLEDKLILKDFTVLQGACHPPVAFRKNRHFAWFPALISSKSIPETKIYNYVAYGHRTLRKLAQRSYVMSYAVLQKTGPLGHLVEILKLFKSCLAAQFCPKKVHALNNAGR